MDPASTGVNAWLDRVPRSEVRLGGRFVPTWQLTAVTGAVTGTCCLTVGTLLSGLPVIVAPLTALSMLLAAAGVARFRRHLTGRETHTLQELTAAALVMSVLVAGLVNSERATTHVDLAAIALAVGLAIGRVGCLAAGCCYGLPAGIGLRYPACCHPDAPLVRRFPVQLLDAAVWVVIGVCGVVAVVRAPAGTATALLLVVYGLIRPALELLRDDRLPQLGGRSVTAWWSFAYVVVGLFIGSSGTLRPATVALWIGLTLTLGLVARELVARWLIGARTVAPVRLEVLRSIAEQLGDASGSGPPISWELGELRLTVAATALGPVDLWTLLFSGVQGPLSRSAASLGLDRLLGVLPPPLQRGELSPTAEGAWVVQLTWPAPEAAPAVASPPPSKAAPVVSTPSNDYLARRIGRDAV